MMNFDYEKLKTVGRTSAKALSYAQSAISPDKKLSDIAADIEKYIEEQGFSQSFPVNLSIDNEAAHYTPTFNDQRTVGKDSVIKIDLGARKDTYLTDCAATVCVGSGDNRLYEASAKALNNAISLVRSGRKVNEIGREIEKTAVSYGFKPIRNLGGHGIGEHELHADIFIPNFDNGDSTALEDGQVIAIEPFMTNGEGYVEDGENIEIFQKTGSNQVRSRDAREIAGFIDSNYGPYPFAVRWLGKEMEKLSEFGIRRALAELSAAGNIEQFPVLRERKGGFVAQAEKTMIVNGDSCIALNG